VGFVENFILFTAVKEFWKSVKNWESYHRYRYEFGELLSLADFDQQTQRPVSRAAHPTSSATDAS